MNPLTEDIRLATLLHIEFNRLRRIFPPHEFYQDAEGLHIPRSVVAAWLARPMWDTLMSHAESLRNVLRCPNPYCGGPVGHAYDCGDA